MEPAQGCVLPEQIICNAYTIGSSSDVDDQARALMLPRYEPEWEENAGMEMVWPPIPNSESMG